MANRRTAIGYLVRTDPAAAQCEIARVIQRRAGCMTDSALDLGIKRRQFFRLVHRFGLWRHVWAERGRHRATNPLEVPHGNGRRTRTDS